MNDVPTGARLVGRGRSAAVYDVGDGLVLRRTTNPDYDAAGEADAMRMAASAGVPVPRVHRVAGRDLIMERVAGPTMLDDLLANPEHLDRHAATLADLHRRLDGVVIAESATRSSVPGTKGVTPFGLLHGDLHPGNVMLTRAGPVLIDWSNYRIGPREVDLAITWILLACFGHDEPAAAGVSSALRATLVGQFLAEVDRTAATAGLREAVELRLADPATGRTEKRCIQALSRGG
jgi:aminoglycoside phosphotransferase (APT) family kinase protein